MTMERAYFMPENVSESGYVIRTKKGYVEQTAFQAEGPNIVSLTNDLQKALRYLTQAEATEAYRHIHPVMKARIKIVIRQPEKTGKWITFGTVILQSAEGAEG